VFKEPPKNKTWLFSIKKGIRQHMAPENADPALRPGITPKIFLKLRTTVGEF
jgi:hypothetical protein